MKNNKRKGITLIALLTTIIVTIIILSAAVISYDNIMQSTQKSEFAKEMYLVKKQVLDYEFLNTSYPLGDEITLDLNTVNVDSKSQFSDEPGYGSDKVTLSKIDLVKADVENIKRGTTKYGESDIYVFSKATKKIYYLLGQTIGYDTYYTLTKELYNTINIYDVE